MTRHVTNERDQFAQVPQGLLYSALSDKAVRVYGVLRRHGDDPTDCFPSHARIAGFIGCAPRSIARPLAELEAAGWIAKEARFLPDKRRTSDGYHIHLTPQKVTSSALPTRENVVGPHAEVRETPHASERDEREQVTTNDTQGLNDAGDAPSRTTPARMDPELVEAGTAQLRALRESLRAPKAAA